MKEKKLVSVVLPVCNEPLHIMKKAIDSILSQTYKNIEVIIIVDNPNNDELTAFLQAFEDNRIRILKNEKNIGLAASLNKGIRYARADIIARMDGDDISFPDRIERELQFLEENNYDLVATDINTINEEGEIIQSKYFVPRSQREFEKRIRYEDCVIHPTWLFRRSCYDSVLGYKEILPAAQDYEFVYHAYVLGNRIGCLDKKLLSYRIRKGNISDTKKIQQLFIAYYTKRTYRKNKQFSNEYIERALRGEEKEYICFKKQLEWCNINVVPKKGLKKKVLQLCCFIRYKYAREIYTDIFLAKMCRILYGKQ